MIYSVAVHDHFEHPRRVGELDAHAADVGNASIGSVDAGQLLRLQIKIRDERIEDARFKAYGCGVTIACGSWLSEWLIGRSLQQARRLKDTDIVEALALPALKIHCAVTARRALTAAVDDYLAKRNSITDKIVDNA